MSAMMKSKFDLTPEEWRPYNTTHQIVSVVQINLTKKTLIGMVELTIVPKKSNLKKVKLNAKQCRIYKILLNDKFETKFDYYDLTQNMIPPEVTQQFSIGQFADYHRDAILEADPDAAGGEVLVHLPPEASHVIVEGRPFRLYIEYALENPPAGVHFYIPEDPSNGEKPHMFTTRYENNSRLWFPCIDSYSEVCTWKLEFTVDESMTAISCGDLVEIVQGPEGQLKKTYHYFLSVPTAAPNIGLAIGPFEVYVDPKMHEVTHFCLPGLMSLLIWTSRFLHEMFEFYEEALSTRFPYSCFKNVFVNEAFDDMTSYASMCIMDISLLHSSAIIDQTYITRKFSALAIAEQFYSNYISMQHSSDAWLSKGISNYLGGLYLRKYLGNNEYRHWIQAEMQDVVKYEQQYGGIILDPSMLNYGRNRDFGHGNESNNSLNSRPAALEHQTSGGEADFYFYLQNPHLVSPEYLQMYAKKAHLVIRMLENRIGSQLLLQVLNKQLSLALIFIQQTEITDGLMRQAPQSTPTTPGIPPLQLDAAPGANPANPMLISTASFTRSIFTVTGKDMTVFMDQWVRQGGHAKFHMSFVFNRKRNTVELELKQECTQQMGIRKYVGPLTVALQELDGTFKHVLQIEATHAKADIVCHSKSRRQKKKKIPLCTGEEVDMDLSAMDSDSPVLWIRLDPEMTLIRTVDSKQPDFQWQYQLRHERDVTAQIEAIWALENFPNPQTRICLTDMIENEQTYYKVRRDACFCLAKVANAMVSTWSGPPAMLGIFRKLFGCFSCPHIIRQNDFYNLHHYFLQKAIPVAMALLRNVHGICPAEINRFLIDLFKYNDNSRDRLSDNYYRAALIQALGNTVTPVVALHHIGGTVTAESLSKDTQIIMEEISQCLNMEKMLQCYKYAVTVECLRSIRKLQKFGHLPNNIEFFQTYAVYGQFKDVRLAALEAIVDYTKTDGNVEDVLYLLDIIQSDPVPSVRHALCRLIITALSEKSVDRRKTKSPFNSAVVVRRLWEKMSSDGSLDSRLRCDYADLYYTVFGTRKPACLNDADSLSEIQELSSRRKSNLTTREVVEDVPPESEPAEVVMVQEESPVKMTQARILSSRRESHVSDNSGELPEAMDTSLPTYFEPGMFKNGDIDVVQNDIGRVEEIVAVEMDVREDGEVSDATVTSTVPPTPKKHHHHHSKAKKKKKEKKKHKHKHKHKHSEHKKKKEETLSSASSASNSP